MEGRTLEELRALARKLGLAGYSRMRKDELLRLLAAHQHKHPDKARKPPADTTDVRPAKQGTAKAGSRPTTGTPKQEPVEPSAPVPITQPATADAEQQVESAKYAFAPPGVRIPAPTLAAGLIEDIDRLPEISSPLLCLLPQKPGVLHGYWTAPPGHVAAPQDLRLRLAQLRDGHIEILEEAPLPAARGHWYFHPGETVDLGTLYLQLGYYDRNGQFISAIERAIARIPSLYASERTDRQWWVSEEQFRAMYLRAGGFASGARFGWAASIGSPAGVPQERLAWPGGVSSQR